MRVFFCKANHGNIRVDTSRTPYTQVIFVNCDGDGSGSRRLSLDRCRYGLEEQQGGQFLVGQPKALWHFFFFFLHKSSSRCPTPTVTLFDRQDGTTQHYSHIQQYQVTEKQINSLYIPGRSLSHRDWFIISSSHTDTSPFSLQTAHSQQP